MSRNHLYRRVSILALAGLVAGCTFVDRGAKFQGAADVLAQKDQFVEIDLPTLLDPENKGKRKRSAADEPDKPISATEKEQQQDNSAVPSVQAARDIQRAYHFFYKYDGDDVKKQRLRRNRVQDQLIAASNQACADFKEKLRQLHSETNLLLGGLTTALAGAGAIVTGALGSQILSGSAGATSGIRAEFNDVYFAQKAVEVLTKAFDVRRNDLLMEIYNKRKKDAEPKMEAYPVERAVADALRYHGACNLITGLEEASERVTLSDNIGFEQLNKMLEKSGMNQTIKLQVEEAESE